MEVGPNEKFALIAFPQIDIHHELPNSLELPNGFFACRALPGELDEHWAEWLGSFQAKDLREADLYIGTKMRSSNPGVLDEENKKLEHRVTAFYWGLFLAGWTRVYHAPTFVTGVMEQHGLNVRQVSTKNRPKFVAGTPLNPGVTSKQLQTAASLGASLEKIYATKDYRRFKRIVGAFQSGIDSHLADIRLHQFIRCLEGFILPRISNTKKDFQHRTKIFIGHEHVDLIGELYDLRSKAEHLHDVFEMYPDIPRHEKFGMLFRRAFEAECLARCCMSRLLSDESLWPHFLNDETLRDFWNSDQAEQQKAWGKPFDFAKGLDQFEANQIRPFDFLEEEE